jgi:Right handed beta helix region
VISLLSLFVLVAGGCACHAATPPPNRHAACDLYASPAGTDSRELLARRAREGRGRPGSRRNPFATPSRLLRALRAGGSGCLAGGLYAGGGRLDIVKGGRDGAPTTLRSAPGQRATLRYGVIHILPTAGNFTLKDLDIDGSDNPSVTIWVEGPHATLEGNWIHNSNAGMSCVIVGQRAAGAITGNRIYNCGRYSDGNQDHGIYAAATNGLKIVDNLFWNTAAFAVHLYPDAQNTLVAHNVIDGNGGGVIFGGDERTASANNIVSHNVISNSRNAYLVQSSWGGGVGTGNLVSDNCLYHGALGEVEVPQTGFLTTSVTIADPLYVNPSRHDYRLGRHSRCLSVVGYDTARTLAGGALPGGS